jgi:hypothetical protein
MLHTTTQPASLKFDGFITAVRYLAGLFDTVSAGSMVICGVFSAINTSPNHSIAFMFGLKFVPG